MPFVPCFLGTGTHPLPCAHEQVNTSQGSCYQICEAVRSCHSSFLSHMELQREQPCPEGQLRVALASDLVTKL